MSGLTRLQLLVAGSPSRASTPAAKFSVTTSEIATSRAQELPAALGAEVERDAELLDVVVVERAAEVDAARSSTKGGTPRRMSQRPAYRVLDADDLRAERGEEAGRAGAGELAR